MTFDRVLDEHLLVLATRVEEAHGEDEVSRAIERAYAAVVRRQRAQLAAGEAPKAFQLYAAIRLELQTLMREH